MHCILVFLFLHLFGLVSSEVIQRTDQIILRCYCTEEKCSQTNNICIIKHTSQSTQPSCYSKFTFDITEKLMSVSHGCTKESKVIKYAGENARKKFKDKRKKIIRDNICTERTDDKTNIDSKRSFDDEEFIKSKNSTEISIKNNHRIRVTCCSEDFCNYIAPEKNNINAPNITTNTDKKTYIFSFNYNDIKRVQDKEKFNVIQAKDKQPDPLSYNVLFLAGEQEDGLKQPIILQSFFTSTNPSTTPKTTLFSIEDKALKILTLIFIVLASIIFAFLNYLACRILLSHEANCHALNPRLLSQPNIYHQTNQHSTSSNEKYIPNVSSEIDKKGKDFSLNFSANSKNSEGNHFNQPSTCNRVGGIFKLPDFMSQSTSKYYPLLSNQNALNPEHF